MLDFLQAFFTESPFIPHGHCYLWKPGLVWLHGMSDGIIALSYYSIPLTLVYFVRKRKDLPFSWLFLLFGVFILSCGTTHIIEVWTLWHPMYWFAGLIKAVTAVVSLYTAMALVPIIPLALVLPSPQELETANRKLEAEIIERKLTEEALRESEERWQLVLQGNNDGIWDWNIKTNQTFRSPRFESILGYEVGELGSSNNEWVARIHPDDLDWVIMANQNYLSRKAPYYAVEYRLLCKNGDYKWVLSRGQAQWDEDGNPVRMVGSMSDITERKQTEIALYQLNAELEERVQERTSQLERANQLLEGQKQVLEMLARGASLSEVLNALGGIVEQHSSDMECSVVVFPKPIKIDSRNVALSGGLRTCYSEPIFSSTGEILGTVTGYYHKPRRSRAEDLQLRQTTAYIAGIAIEYNQVEQERSRLVAILQASSDYIGTADPQCKSLWYNIQLKKALGLEIDADISDRLITSNHPEWAVELIENQGLPGAIEGGIWVGETALLHSDGVEIPVSQMIIAHKSPDGNVEYFSTIMRDISDLKQAELVLRESEERFRATFEQAAVGIAHVSIKGQFIWLNEKFCSLVGYTQDEMQHSMFQDITYPEDLEADLTYVHQLLEGKINTYSMEKRYIRKDRSLVWVALTVSLLRNANNQPQYFIGVVKDISQRKQAEQTLKALNAELARSNQELEQFAYVASHDLREPLRKIKSYTDLLVKRYQGKLDEKADKYIDYISDGAVRMQALITDLLTYSRVGKGELTKQPTDLNYVLNQTLNDLSKVIRENKASITADSLPTVNANAIQIGQLLQNLIANALKFKSEQAPQIQINASLHDQTWTISVQDNGIGIDPQYAERIFVIFQRLHTRDEYEGTGMGLAICKKIVERHGGQLWLKSERGQGTTFFFTLPAMP